jgi:hypothetical protein
MSEYKGVRRGQYITMATDYNAVGVGDGVLIRLGYHIIIEHCNGRMQQLLETLQKRYKDASIYLSLYHDNL